MIEDGGCAFPLLDSGGFGLQNRDAGMSLRDWLAGQALTTVIATCNNDERENGETWPQMFARKSCAVADAMLAARKVTSDD
jgi:hypothetical protein